MRRVLIVLFILLFFAIPLFAQDESSAENCIVLMGDSLPAGTFVALLPGTGVTVLQGGRISHLLDDALQEANLLHYGIYDLSLPAGTLTSPTGEPYLTSREFVIGQSLNCRYVVIFPFLNDLYIADDSETGIASYETALETMLNTIRQQSPDGHIILSNFYGSVLQGAGGDTYGADVSAAHVLAMNTGHQRFCEMDTQIHCLILSAFLIPIENYVAGAISQDEYIAQGYTPLNPDDRTMIDAYWLNTPNNPIYGDGLHLNPDGQAVVVRTLMQWFDAIDPVNFAPILQ